MMEFGSCPQCKMDISPERKKLTPIICDHCGHTPHTDSGKVANDLYRRSLYAFLGISVFVVASYIQIANWDSAWLSIIPLSIKDVIGASSKSDFEAKAQICLDLKKYDCTEEAYLKVAAREPIQYNRAAHFEMQRGKYQDAAQAYYKFFTAGNQDLDASYNYAKALTQLGKVDDAVKYFDQVLAARPETLQVTVIHNYVKLLVDNKRYDAAKDLIERVRKDGGEFAGTFMDDEFKKIQQLRKG